MPFAWPVYPQRIPTYLTQCEQYAYLQLGSSLIRADDAISTINEQIARQRDGYFTLSESLHMLREMYSSSPKFLKENIHSAFRKRTLRIYQKPGHPLDFEDQVHDFHFIKANDLDSLLIGRFPGYRFPFAESSNKTTHRLEPGKKTVPNEKTDPVQRQPSQENQILKLLTEFGYNPKSLPARKPGKAGVKAEMRQFLDWEGTIFEKAWDRLRARRDILGG